MLRLLCVRGTQHDSILLHLGGENSWGGGGGGWRCVVLVGRREERRWGGGKGGGSQSSTGKISSPTGQKWEHQQSEGSFGESDSPPPPTLPFFDSDWQNKTGAPLSRIEDRIEALHLFSRTLQSPVQTQSGVRHKWKEWKEREKEHLQMENYIFLLLQQGLLAP